MLKASSGTNRLRTTPSRVSTAVSAIPPNGTPLRFIFAVNAGPLPFIAIERSTRPVEYKPALRLDIAAVSTTMFMMPPAAGTPILEKKVTKGLSPLWYAVYGSSSANTTNEPT